MIRVREIFYLHFGKFKEAKKLIEQWDQQFTTPAKERKVLSDYTGMSYRLILEETYESLNDWEKGLNRELGAQKFQDWYVEFKKLVRYSEREILKVIW